jgi:hypothetical protein
MNINCTKQNLLLPKPLFGVLNTILFYFLFFPLFFEQELVVFSPSFDQYTSFLLTLVTTQHNFQLRGRTRINQDGWCSTKKKTREGNMWRVESKGGMGGFFFVYIYAASNDDQIKDRMEQR